MQIQEIWESWRTVQLCKYFYIRKPACTVPCWLLSVKLWRKTSNPFSFISKTTSLPKLDVLLTNQTFLTSSEGIDFHFSNQIKQTKNLNIFKRETILKIPCAGTVSTVLLPILITLHVDWWSVSTVVSWYTINPGWEQSDATSLMPSDRYWHLFTTLTSPF